ncbi:lipid II flippase MurJ, partial [Nocardioides sp. SYSU DS0663]|uniref:lipid II flippase MurJ n=1 Tax=Nocardioides sp. SYSU DS0663 TaxID=3416445 RepID=UPI003F4C87B8
NQLAYTVVVRLASTGTIDGDADSTGYSVYSAAFLIVMVPHAVITVSLATAILPGLSRRAAERDLRGLGHSLSTTLRTALAVVLPFAALLPLIAPDLARLISYGAAADTFENYIPSLALFGPGLALFTVHYLMLRGFYALEQTRTVFWIQCAVATANIVAAVVLVNATGDPATAPALVVAYAVAYLVGAVVSYLVLARRLGGLRTPVLVRFLVRMALAVGVATAAAWLASLAFEPLAGDASYLRAAVSAVVVTGVDVAVFLVAARLLRLHEVTSVVTTFTRRLPLPGRR